jgi:hypothetical protein
MADRGEMEKQGVKRDFFVIPPRRVNFVLFVVNLQKCSAAKESAPSVG